MLMYKIINGTLKNQAKQDENNMHHNTFTPSQHLVPFCQLCFVFVSRVHSRVVEGGWESIAGCVVHVDVRGERVCCGWLQCSCYGAWQV